MYLFNFVLSHIGDSFFDVRIPKKINVEAGRTFIIQGVDYVCIYIHLQAFALVANQCTSCRAQIAVENYCMWAQFHCGVL